MGTLNHCVLSFRPVNEWKGGKRRRYERMKLGGSERGGGDGEGSEGREHATALYQIHARSRK